MKLQRPESAERAERMTLCPDCGVAHEGDDTRNPRCPDCRPEAARQSEAERVKQQTTAERGYGYRWQQLSRRARKLQDFCSDCGSPDDLTADHSVTAWQRVAEGKVIRLQDIDVVCRRCNSERGDARGIGATDDHRLSAAERLARIKSDPDL